MSVHILVLLRSQSLPSTADWQGQLDALGIELRLDDQREPGDGGGGYWPAWLAELWAGFEFCTGPVSEVFGDQLPEGAEDRDLVGDFVLHAGDNLKGPMLAAAAFAVVADGVVLDEDTGGTMSAEDFLIEARSVDI